MLSFVLQNFYKTNTYLVKTLRYHSFVRSNNQILIYMFLKNIILFSKIEKFNFSLSSINRYFFNVYFISRFWLLFKKLFYKRYGLYSNNLVKSIMYNFFNGLNNLLYDENIFNPITNWYKLDNTKCSYSRPVTVVNFSLNTKLYKSYILFVINKLITVYIPFIPTFSVNYSFFFLQNNFHFYVFLNCFYFKIHNV